MEPLAANEAIPGGGCRRLRRVRMEGRELLEGVIARMNERQDKLKGITSDYVVELTGDGGGRFRLRVQDGQVGIVPDEGQAPKAAVTLSTTDFADLLAEKASAMGLFMQGRVRLQGDMSEAFRLESLLRS